MEQKFKNSNCPLMTHDKWVSFGYISTETNLAKAVFEFLDI